MMILLLPLIYSICDEYCIDCKNNICYKCTSGRGVNKRESSETYGQCIQCRYECSECGSDVDYCSKCTTRLNVDNDKTSLTYGKCILTDYHCKKSDQIGGCDECYSGFGLDENKRCQKCSSDCADCLKENYKYCSFCDFDHYVDMNIESSTYRKCILRTKVDNCIEYEITSNICKKCEKGFHLDDEKNVCIPCDKEFCDECDFSYLLCSKCKNGYIEQSYKCVDCSNNGNCDYCNGNKCSSCKSGYFLDKDNNVCIKRIPECNEHKLIEGEYKCIDCDSSYTLNENGKCEKCKKEGCSDCTGDVNTCINCYSDYDYINGKCVEKKKEHEENCDRYSSYDDTCQSCNIHYGFDQNGKCISCQDKNCYNCNNDYSICSICKNGYGFNSDGVYVPWKEKNCGDCFKNYQICKSCSLNSIMQNNVCTRCNDENCRICWEIDWCYLCAFGYSQDFRKNSSTYFQCIQCPYKCKSCVNGYPNICEECEENYTLNSNFLCTDEVPDDGNDALDRDSSSKKKFPVGAIVGIVVGGVLVIGVAIFLTVYCYKKKGGISNSSN